MVGPTPVQLRFFSLDINRPCKMDYMGGLCSQPRALQSRILREQPAAKPFTSSREEGKTRANTRTHTSPQFGPLCTRWPTPCARLHTAPRPPPTAPGRTGGSVVQRKAQGPGCGQGGLRSQAPRGSPIRQRQPPRREGLRPALQHGGGGGGGGGRAAVGPALAAVTGTTAPPRLRVWRDPRPGQRASPCARACKPGSFWTDSPWAGGEGPRGACKSPGKGGAGALQGGGGEKAEKLEVEANF